MTATQIQLSDGSHVAMETARSVLTILHNLHKRTDADWIFNALYIAARRRGVKVTPSQRLLLKRTELVVYDKNTRMVRPANRGVSAVLRNSLRQGKDPDTGATLTIVISPRSGEPLVSERTAFEDGGDIFTTYNNVASDVNRALQSEVALHAEAISGVSNDLRERFSADEDESETP